MSWLKIDDGLFLHPKWISSPTAARALWITALSYTGKMNTDGLVPAALLPILGGTTEDADALVASGLWIMDGDAYRFHDYAEYNRTSDQQAEIAQSRSSAGAAGAASRWQKNGKTIAKNGKSMAKNGEAMAKNAPEPEPEPVPLEQHQHNYSTVREATRPADDASAAEIHDGEDRGGDGELVAGADPLTPVGRLHEYVPGSPLPISVENFLTHCPSPDHWRERLEVELAGRQLHSLDRYALKLLREWKLRGGPPAVAPERPRALTRSEATRSIRQGLATVMAAGDGF